MRKFILAVAAMIVLAPVLFDWVFPVHYPTKHQGPDEFEQLVLGMIEQHERANR